MDVQVLAHEDRSDNLGSREACLKSLVDSGVWGGWEAGRWQQCDDMLQKSWRFLMWKAGDGDPEDTCQPSDPEGEKFSLYH